MNTFRLSWRRFSFLFRRHLRPTSSLSSTTFQSHTQSLSSLSSSFFSRHFKFPAIFLHDFSNLSFKPFFSESSSSSSEIRRCWNCNSSPTTSQLFLVCDSCRCIQPVDSSVDYFRIFGLERKYDIEENSLEGLYKDWQKKLHPDLVHSKSESEKEYAAEQSSRIIDAYRTLKNSLSRAIYLMKLQGVHVDEEQTVSDPELLAEIMEIRESVEDAPDPQALKQIQAEVHERLKQWSNTFAGAFKSQDIEEALNAIRRMTYYKRANEEIVKRL
ncbi:iron-sulfur cluster co-chaperone protein HscB, mitochondrial-like [Chenopodium quinoa]|uniref:iron-sulfur cluster co-chaperone protein HscB, mitochondrial-like n=1 Tax=Chenopodium quinoa TaxID=63459 RepID=UPI000B78C4E5|nr:iron-sulfur cluster co-chaperone protein HscB, mitochondrial-like [Chenopodium quinoa]